MYDSPNYYSSVDQLLGANGITNEPLPYLNPVKAIGRFANNDYEALPQHDSYVEPHSGDLFNDVQYDVVDYSLPTGNCYGSNTMQSNSYIASR